MRNPARRNRNIGTARQGHGQNNKLAIPGSWASSRVFFEQLSHYTQDRRMINGHEFIFVTEQTRADSRHACTIYDVAKIISHIPASDYGALKLIVFRQPKRKEEILSPVWGRLAYAYEFEKDIFPAIILEAVDYQRKFEWPSGLSPEQQKELGRLIADGHPISRHSRGYTAPYLQEHVRSTQLYRTLPHEFGHYVHYLETVIKPGNEEELPELTEEREDKYFNIPKAEKEVFAHTYADKLRTKLALEQVIPFEPLSSL